MWEKGMRANLAINMHENQGGYSYSGDKKQCTELCTCIHPLGNTSHTALQLLDAT